MCACLWAFVSSRLGEWQGCQLWRDGGHRIGFPFYYVWLLFVNIFPPWKMRKLWHSTLPLFLRQTPLAEIDVTITCAPPPRCHTVTHVWFCRRRRLFLQQTRTDSIQKVCGCIWQSFVHFKKLPKVYNIFCKWSFFMVERVPRSKS